MMNRLEAAARQALEWIEDATVVLSHTSTAIQGGLGAEAEGVGGCSVKVLKDLREALAEQQAAEPNAVLVEGFGRVALRKLNDLHEKGYAINGVSIATISEAGETQLGAVTTGGRVLWWPQQPAQQAAEPVAEPIYQCQDSTGKWTDQAKHSYDYNVKHGSAVVRVVYTNPAPTQQPLTLGPLARRRVFDYIRGAYDLGYNDARNAKAVPGDGAPGYKGRDVEADHGGALLHALEALGAQTTQQAAEPATSPTTGMNMAQHILHVGGRNNAAGYGEFGSIQAVEALVRQVLRDLPTQQPLTDEQAALAAEAVDQIMEQAQVFASAWSLVGGRFDAGDGMENADAEKAALRTMVVSLARQAAHGITGSKEGGAA